MPQTIQKIESAFLLGLFIFFYAQMGFSWLLFAVLLLAPDIFMLGYLKNLRIGAIAYNIGHSYFMPVFVLMLYYVYAIPHALPVALVWFAHIALDRMLGYGLKFDTGFKDTHLGKLR